MLLDEEAPDFGQRSRETTTVEPVMFTLVLCFLLTFTTGMAAKGVHQCGAHNHSDLQR